MRADLVVQIRVELAAPGERAEEAGEARNEGQGYFAFTALPIASEMCCHSTPRPLG